MHCGQPANTNFRVLSLIVLGLLVHVRSVANHYTADYVLINRLLDIDY